MGSRHSAIFVAVPTMPRTLGPVSRDSSSHSGKLRWGVLGAAKIAITKVIPAMQGGRHNEVVALASRDLDRARAAAEQLGLFRAYGSYDALLADPDVDAVYIPLPNHLHVPWSLRALEAGKHVLCEKPVALSAAEATTLLEAARRHPDLKVMEAFMYRHHPQWHRVRAMVGDGAIGSLRTVHCTFAYHNVDPANIRNQARMGGGGLMDIGCYGASVARLLFDAEPGRVCAVVERDEQFGTDRLATALLDFGRGTATFTASTQMTPYQEVQLFGTTGAIHVEAPFNPPLDRPVRLWHRQDGRVDEILVAPENQFTLQGDLFARAVLDGTPVPTPLEDAVANMRVLDAVVSSAKSRAWTVIP
jgi:predicted dehydrogenase